MQVEGVITKIIEPKLLGVFKTYNVYLCHGKYGEYFRHNSVNYSIPEFLNKNRYHNLQTVAIVQRLVLHIVVVATPVQIRVVT